jgi:hypothetical protein
MNKKSFVLLMLLSTLVGQAQINHIEMRVEGMT